MMAAIVTPVPTMIYISLGVFTTTFLSAACAYISLTRRYVCPLMADSLLNGAVLMGVFSVMLLSNLLGLIDPANRASINVIFSLVAIVVQAQIIAVHHLYHRIVEEGT